MKVTIVGSGGWGGIPAPFCDCKVCKEASKNPLGKNSRTRPQLLVETNNDRFLIEVSPDIRLQSTRFELPYIKNFLVTHNHFDHLSGIAQLNSWIRYHLEQKPIIYTSKSTIKTLYKLYDEIPFEPVRIKAYKKYDLFGLTITPLPLYHESKVDKDVSEDKIDNAFGYLLEENGKKIAYLGDYYKIPKKALEFLRNLDVVILDGTYLFEELFPKGLEQESLKEDPDHMHGKQIIDFAQKIKAKKTIFNNITHLANRTHNSLQKLLPKEYYISYDGMEITL